MSNKKEIKARYLLTDLVASAIIALTLVPMGSSTESIPMFEGADKVVHAAMFFFFAGAFIWDDSRGRRAIVVSWNTMVVAVVLSAIVGGVIELLQEWMNVGRSGDVLDWVADVVGAVLAVIILRTPLNRLLRKTQVQLKRLSSLVGEKGLIYKEIYLNSFPPEERREWNKIVRFAVDRNHPLSFYAIKFWEEPVGFITAWQLPGGWTYVEHFAVSQECRGEGVGKRALEEFCDRHEKIVLEVELPEEGEMAQRRIAFYERSGFEIESGFEYVQPSYGEGLPEVPMLMMTTGRDGGSLEEIARMIKSIVYEK